MLRIATNIYCVLALCQVLSQEPSMVTRRIPVNGFAQSMCTMSTCVCVCVHTHARTYKGVTTGYLSSSFPTSSPHHAQAEVLGEGEL